MQNRKFTKRRKFMHNSNEVKFSKFICKMTVSSLSSESLSSPLWLSASSSSSSSILTCKSGASSSSLSYHLCNHIQLSFFFCFKKEEAKKERRIQFLNNIIFGAIKKYDKVCIFYRLHFYMRNRRKLFPLFFV